MSNLPAGPEPPSTPPPVRSIHYRRRWAYVLWIALLLLSLGALFLWERPAAVVTASLQVKLQIREAPPGTVVQAWAGPWAEWTGPGQFAGAPVPVALQADGTANLPVFHMRIARRRWVQDYIPRSTWDLLVFRLTAPGQPCRYTVLPVSRDIRTGLLRPRWRLTTVISTRWGALDLDPKIPDQKP